MARDGEITGKYSALLAGTEVGVGGLLHAWHVPFAGHFLSLNQGFLLSKATQKEGDATAALRVSLVAATLKSLSPVGKRLTPMLAITVQGGLFAFGQWIGGVGRLGTILGMVLLALWGFVQPVLLYLLIFGRSLLEVGSHLVQQLEKVIPLTLDSLVWGLLFLIGIKVGLSVVVGWMAHSSQSEKVQTRLAEWIGPVPLCARENPSRLERGKQVVRDLTQPWFLLTLFFVATFAWVTQPSHVEWVWLLLRPIAVGAIVFYSLRYLPVDRWLVALWGKHSKMARALEHALGVLRPLDSAKESQG